MFILHDVDDFQSEMVRGYETDDKEESEIAVISSPEGKPSRQSLEAQLISFALECRPQNKSDTSTGSSLDSKTPLAVTQTTISCLT